MHSQKMMKVLGAGLTAAALTLGAAMPALAEVTVGEPNLIFSDTSDEVLDISKSGESLEIRVPISSTSDSKSGASSFTVKEITISGFDEWGNTQEKVFDSNSGISFLKSNGTDLVSGDKASDAAYMTLKLDNNNLNGFASGTFAVTKIELNDNTDSKKKVTFEPAEALFEIKGGTKVSSVIEIKLDKLEIKEDSIDLDNKASYTNDVSVAVSGVSTSGSVEFIYESPSGKELTASGSISGGTAKANIPGLGNTDDWQLNGVYTLKSIKAKEGVNYLELTNDIDDLSDGDFIVYGGKETTVYRLYNPNSSEHFYTVKSGEKDLLVEAGWKYEGVAFKTLSESDSGAVEVFRVYNPNGGDHHFTMSEGERDLLVAAGWRNEGVAFYSAGSTKDGSNERVYRVYNPNAETGSHHYTLSSGEKDLLVSAGWNDEGTAWFAKKSE